MTSKTPKFSAVMASYNGAATLRRSIESLRRQTYPAKELIVVDGGSTDETMEIVKSYGDLVSYAISEPDRGILDAWNKGLKHVTGDWIHFLGADDYYYDDMVFENMVEHFADHQHESKLIYGTIQRVNRNGEFVEWHGQPWNPERFRQVGMCIPHTAAFHHRSLFEEYGDLEPDRPIGLVYEYLLRYLKDHDAVCVPIVVACMIVGGESNRPENHLAFVRETFRAQRIHGTTKPNVYMLARGRSYLSALVKYGLGKALPDPLYFHTLDFIRKIRGRRPMYSWRTSQ